MKRNVLTLTVLLAITACWASAQIRIIVPIKTGTYTLTDLHPAAVPAQWSSAATAIDNSGRAVGASRNSAGSTDAFQTQPNAPFVDGAPGDLGVLPNDLTAEAYAINNKGLIVGESVNTSGSRAFLFVPGTGPGTGMQDLNTKGSLGNMVISNAVKMHAAGINDQTWIVGSFWTASDTLGSHSFLSFGPGSTQAIDSALGNPAHSTANDVNNNGQVVGSLSQTANSQPIAYFLDFGTQHLLKIGTLPGMDMSVANALNDSGKVVGTSQTSISSHAFVFQDLNHNGVVDQGELTDLDPTDNASGAYGINSGGTVVGYLGGAPFLINGTSRAAIFVNGVATDLNTLVPSGTGDWTLRVAYAINDGGQIVGFMQNGRYGDVHAFRLDPIVISRLF
jgi:probable HAF family extracellular repeat protein